MNWVDSLKLALLEQDSQKAYEIASNLPQEGFKDLEELLDAKELVSQVIDILQKEKEKTYISMQQIKIAKKFLQD